MGKISMEKFLCVIVAPQETQAISTLCGVVVLGTYFHNSTQGRVPSEEGIIPSCVFVDFLDLDVNAGRAFSGAIAGNLVVVMKVASPRLVAHHPAKFWIGNVVFILNLMVHTY